MLQGRIPFFKWHIGNVRQWGCALSEMVSRQLSGRGCRFWFMLPRAAA